MCLLRKCWPSAMGWAEWPARLQKLEDGKLFERLTQGSQLWVDGGHNPLAAQAIAAHFEGTKDLHIVAGLLAGPGNCMKYRLSLEFERERYLVQGEERVIFV